MVLRKRKRAWTKREDRDILASGYGDDVLLAQTLDRTVFAIRKRRERLKRKGVKLYLEPWEAKLKEVELGQWKPTPLGDER